MAARGSVLAYSVQPVPQEYYPQQPLHQVQQHHPQQHQPPHQQYQQPPPPEGNRQSLHHRHRRQRQPHHHQQQRHQQARSSCSSSSQEDDQSQQGYGVRNGGYSSNETLRMSEVPISPTSEDGKEPFPNQQQELRYKEESLCHPAVRMEPPIAEHIAEERPYYDGLNAILNPPSSLTSEGALYPLDPPNPRSHLTRVRTLSRAKLPAKALTTNPVVAATAASTPTNFLQSLEQIKCQTGRLFKFQEYLGEIGCFHFGLVDSVYYLLSYGKERPSDLKCPSTDNFDSTLGSMEGSINVSTSTRGDMNHDQLLQEVDHYLHKQSLDAHSTGSHSTRSSLTMTETEMEHDMSLHNHGDQQGAIRLDHLSSMPGYPPIGLSTYPHLHNGAFQGTPATHQGRGASLPTNGVPYPPHGIVYHQLQPTNEDEEETTFMGSLPHSYSTGTGIYSSIKENQYNSIGDPNSLRHTMSNTASQTLPGASGMYLQPRTGNIIHAVPLMTTCDLQTLHTTSSLATNSGNLNELNNARHRQERLFEYPLSMGTGVPMPVYPGMNNGKRTNDASELKYPTMQEKYGCKDHMSWRCLAVILVLLTVALLALVTYFAVTLSRPLPSMPNTVNIDDTRPTSSGNLGNEDRTTRRPKRPPPPNNEIELTTAFTTTTSPVHSPAIPYTFGTAAQREIPPGHFWTLFSPVDSSTLIQFNLTLSRRNGFVMYGQQARAPSHSFYDFMQVHVGTGRRGKRSVDTLDSETLDAETPELTYHDVLRLGGLKYEESKAESRVKRSNSHLMHTWSFMEELNPGEWYIAVFNDGPYAEEVNLVTRHKSGWSCPGDCSGHGECLRGQCLCQEEYTGDDCSQGVCPVLCSGRGQYVHGFCECVGGWKGPECSIPWDQCLVADCSRHGVCLDGECVCSPGFTGEACEQEVLIDDTLHCSNDTDCFPNAQCISGMCHCLEGWTGSTCEEEECILPCSPHGECVDNACNCEEGWNGKLCGLEGCPFGCSGHGSCELINSTWSCVCEGLYHGPGCSIGTETDCTDEVDNDGDSLIDCEDPDCCLSASICIGDALCEAPPDPVEVIRSSPPLTALTPSILFYDRVKFLIEPNSIHRSPPQVLFSNESVVSVVRGKVLSHKGSPVVGVRVQVDNRPFMGFTYTREDGMFDMMVVGGGSISFSFARHPFITAHIPTYIPYNDIVLMEDIRLELLPGRRSVSYSVLETVHCEGNAYIKPEFSLLPRAVMDSCGSQGIQGAILDQRAMHEQVEIPGTRATLDYYSQRAVVNSLMSTFTARLTDYFIPRNLKLVHAVVTLAGRRFHKVLEPEPFLNYTFSWDKLDAYGQPVYGDEEAVVAIGYEYHTCTEIIWSRQSTTLPGYDWSTTSLAGWDLPMHHTYDPQKAVLQLGDGCQVKYSQQPPIIQTIVGNGRPRNADCNQCEGKAKGARILAPMAVASSPDGSYYVGDGDFIRRVGPEGNITNVLHLGYMPTYKYYMAVSPLDGKVYLSDSQMRQVFRLRDLKDVPDINDNVVLVAGTGQACPPIDGSECGNNGDATQARLIAPKGIAIGKDGTVYFVDGTVIRKITTDGTIHAFLGTPGIQGPLRLPQCRGTMAFSQVKLQFPTELAVNPLDDAVYVADDDIIIRLGQDQRASVLAGVPYNCPLAYSIDLGQSDGSAPDDNISTYEYLRPRPANEVALIMPSSMAFSRKGDLYVAEANHRTINRISKISSDGFISRYAGQETTCDCLLEDCDCFSGDKFYAMDARLHGPIALAVMPNDQLIVADQGNLRLRMIAPKTPKHRVGRFHAYQIVSPNREEVYFFDMYGVHTLTKNLISDQVVYNITHSGNLLDSVTDSAGVVLGVQRRLDGQPSNIVVSGMGTLLQISLDQLGRLSTVHDTLKNIIHQFGYHGDTDLLSLRWEGQSLKRMYEYEENGRLSSVRHLNGQMVTLESAVNSSVSSVTINQPWQTNLATDSIRLDGYVSSNLSQADLIDSVVISHDKSTLITFPNGLVMGTESQPHPLLEMGVEGSLSKRKIKLPETSPHRLDWNFYVRKGGRNRDRVLVVGRKLRINGENILSMEYNRLLRKDTVLDQDSSQLLEISYNNAKLPMEWKPAFGFILTNASYDSQGRLTRWQRDLISESYGYDNFGRLKRIHRGTNGTWRFTYTTGMLPSEVTLPSRQHYAITYDGAGNAARVTMPTGKHHYVNSVPSVGYHRILYSDGNRPWLIVDQTEEGLPLRRYSPGTSRRMAYVYDNKGRISEIYYDQTSVKYKYNREESQVKLLELQVGDFSNAERLRYDGPMVKQKIIRASGFVGFMNGRFEYIYDRNMRLLNVFAEFNTTVLPEHNRAYDPVYGRLTQLGAFTLSYPDVTIQNYTDQNFEMTKKFGTYILLQEVQYKVRAVTMGRLELLFDISSRIIWNRLQVGDSSHTTNYSYDANGQLTEVHTDSQIAWQYTYDSNGNLASFTHRQNTTHLYYDDFDRITRIGQIEYLHDEDGFLLQRGGERFTYDSRGQLVHAFQLNVYEVRYKYDGSGRRIWRKDHTGRQIQYFYADIDQPHRITHVYDHSRQEIWSYEYDLQGYLFAVKQNQRQLYVCVDQVGSPIAVYDENRNARKIVEYDPRGNILHDSSPVFMLHVGFRGGLYDAHTKLVQFNGRDYDSLSGQWTSADESFYADIARPQKTTSFNLYTFHGNNPVNPKLHPNYLMSLEDWLPVLGYDMTSLVPEVNRYGKPLPSTCLGPYRDLRQPTTLDFVNWAKVKWGYEQQAMAASYSPNTNFHAFPNRHTVTETSPTSVLGMSPRSESSVGYASLPTLIDKGVILAISGERVICQKAPDVDSDALNIATVVNNSLVLDRWHYSDGQREVRFFVKSDLTRYVSDLRSLGYNSNITDTSDVVDLHVGTVHMSAQMYEVPYEFVVISLSNNYTMWKVFYGITMRQAAEVVLESAREVAMHQAWLNERRVLASGLRGTYFWTSEERISLLQNNMVPGYEGQYTLDPMVYPEIAFDGNNIKIVRSPSETTR